MALFDNIEPVRAASQSGAQGKTLQSGRTVPRWRRWSLTAVSPKNRVVEAVKATIVIPVGLILGIVIAAGPMVVLGSDSPDMNVALPAWVLLTIGLSLVGPVWTTPVWAAMGVGLALPAWVIALVMVGKGGNLFPIAILAALIVSVPTAVVGMVGGMVVTRFVTKKTRVAATLVAISLMMGVGPAVFASVRMVGREADALTHIRWILAAQDAYRSQGPEGRYACSLGELSEGPQEAGAPPPIGEDGWLNGYRFRLFCQDGTGATFMAAADPRILPRTDVRWALGRTKYCVNEDGQLLSLPVRPRGNCWTDGVPVHPDRRR